MLVNAWMLFLSHVTGSWYKTLDIYVVTNIQRELWLNAKHVCKQLNMHDDVCNNQWTISNDPHFEHAWYGILPFFTLQRGNYPVKAYTRNSL